VFQVCITAVFSDARVLADGVSCGALVWEDVTKAVCRVLKRHARAKTSKMSAPLIYSCGQSLSLSFPGVYAMPYHHLAPLATSSCVGHIYC